VSPVPGGLRPAYAPQQRPAAGQHKILTSVGRCSGYALRVRGSLTLVLLIIASVLPAGCGGATSSPNKPPVSSLRSEQHVSLPNEQAALTRLARLHGRAYVEASRSLPDQIETR
jgi:hypothetical protein